MNDYIIVKHGEKFLVVALDRDIYSFVVAESDKRENAQQVVDALNQVLESSNQRTTWSEMEQVAAQRGR